MNNLPRPPAHVEPYVRILGTEGAVAFFLAFGGGELYLPVTPAAVARSAVAKILGVDAALALGQAHLPRRVPTAKPWLARVKSAQGLTVTEIARILHASDVSVRAWLRDDAPRQPPVDDRQLPLI